jgi:predicted metal-dependent phosphoesterase TrpH
MKNLIFHIHTHHSYDSLNKVSGIIGLAQKNNIQVVAVTDHDTLKGSVEAQKYVQSKKLDIEIIIGAEYKTSQGDVIALFIQEDIKAYDAFEVIDQIHRQNGIAIIPHPAKSKKLTRELIEKADIIEVFNARCSNEQNHEALNLARELNKPAIGGSDAHLISEVANVCNQIDADLSLKQAILNSCQIIQKKPASKNAKIVSQLIKSIKQKNITLFFKQIKSIVSVNLINPVRNRFTFKRQSKNGRIFR